MTTVSDAADITVDGTAGGVVLLAANTNRKSATITNTGAASMRVRIDGDPTTTRGYLVVAGATLVLSSPHCPTGEIKGIRTTSTSTTAYPAQVV